MKYWKTLEKENHNEYVILNENSIGLILKNSDIGIEYLSDSDYDELYHFKDIEEIALNEEGFTLKILFKDDDTEEKILKLTRGCFIEIKSFLTKKLTNIEVNNYAYVMQFLHHKFSKSLASAIFVSIILLILKKKVDNGADGFFGIRLDLSNLFDILSYRIIYITSAVIIVSLTSNIIKSLVNPKKGILIEFKQPTRLIF